MSHFLRKDEAWGRRLGRPYAAVRVRVEYRKRVPVLILDPENPVMIMDSDLTVAELPPRVRLLNQDGEDIQASGTFLVSTCTFDPYHVVLDYLE